MVRIRIKRKPTPITTLINIKTSINIQCIFIETVFVILFFSSKSYCNISTVYTDLVKIHQYLSHMVKKIINILHAEV